MILIAFITALISSIAVYIDKHLDNGIFYENRRKKAKTKRPICSILSSCRNWTTKCCNRINIIQNVI